MSDFSLGLMLGFLSGAFAMLMIFVAGEAGRENDCKRLHNVNECFSVSPPYLPTKEDGA